MATVLVDGNNFTFPDDWQVEVYDSWRFSSKLAGVAISAKACDLVAIADDVLYLIEAKDYTYPPGTRPPKLQDLAATVAGKTFHTLAGLFAGSKYPFEKQEFCKKAINCGEIRLYLSAEFPADKGLLRSSASFRLITREALAKEVKPFLASRPVVVSNQSGGAPWVSARDAART